MISGKKIPARLFPTVWRMWNRGVKESEREKETCLFSLWPDHKHNTYLHELTMPRKTDSEMYYYY